MAGETYPLAVNNFTSTGAGFPLIEGGTVGFEGPEVTLLQRDPDSTICLGEKQLFTVIPSCHSMDLSNPGTGILEQMPRPWRYATRDRMLYNMWYRWKP